MPKELRAASPRVAKRRVRFIQTARTVLSPNSVAVRVDAGHPNAWRREPYYSQLKRWSRAAVESRGQVVVYVKRRVIVILPDKDVDFGDVDLGDQIWVGAFETPAGRTWNAVRIPADLPPERVNAWIAAQVRV